MDILVSVSDSVEGKTKFYLEENDNGDWELWSTDEDPSSDALLATIYDQDFAEKVLDLVQPKVFADPEDEDDEYDDFDEDEYDEGVDEFIEHNKKGTWDGDSN